jgi:hypothetical protein
VSSRNTFEIASLWAAILRQAGIQSVLVVAQEPALLDSYDTLHELIRLAWCQMRSADW